MSKKERKTIGPVELTDMAYGGEAVGRYEGLVLFVNGGAAGDVANVDVTISKKSFSRGRIAELITPSPVRTEAPCPYYNWCGGCQWQHVIYQEQLNFKQHLVAEAFERIGRLEANILPILGMADPWHYRNTMEFGFTWDGEPGFRPNRGHRIVPVRHCMISRPEINETLTLLWKFFAEEKMASVLPNNAFVRIGEGAPAVVVGLLGHGDWPDIADRMMAERPDLIAGIVQRKGRTSDKGRTLEGRDYTSHDLLGKRYRASLASFFQVNRTQVERMVQIVLDWLRPQAGETILDAFSGVGTFSLQIGDKVGRIVAVESGPSANADARVNCAGMDNLELVEGFFGEVPLPVDRVDGVVIDPPRGGCTPEGLKLLADLSPSRIIYVSCDPTTLARDAALLVEAGYSLERVQPMDLFPHTYHAECCAQFERVKHS